MDPKLKIEQRCQSCGMPLAAGEKSDSSFFGMNADGTFNKDYCKFCWVAGGFAEPHLTVSDMINKSVSHMTRVLKVPDDQAKRMAAEIIPKLKRWTM
jgi:hypothetical protein